MPLTSNVFYFTEFLTYSRYSGIQVSSGDANSGLGLYATQSLKPTDIVIQVPTKLTLSVESPVDYNTVMEKTLFEISKMDCPSDENLIRLKLAHKKNILDQKFF